MTNHDAIKRIALIMMMIIIKVKKHNISYGIFCSVEPLCCEVKPVVYSFKKFDDPTNEIRLSFFSLKETDDRQEQLQNWTEQ